MARYDRIAPLAPPRRDQAFPAWLITRDLEGRDRDPELARRARLRFLALRPVSRLVKHGAARVPLASYRRQIEGVREELGHLSARDPERARLAHFLDRIAERSPLSLATATFELGEVAETASHYYGAEEFYLTGLELAEVYDLLPQQVAALRLLSRVYRKAERWDESQSCATRSAKLALEASDRGQWAQAMEALGQAHWKRGEQQPARDAFARIISRGREWGEHGIVRSAAVSLCRADAEAGLAEPVIESGWLALGLANDDDSADAWSVLDPMATAFTRLGLFRAAERCHEIAMARAADAAGRSRSLASRALVAAEAKDAVRFRRRRDEVLTAAAELGGETGPVAHMHLDLGRGALLIGDVDSARDHLREAISSAERHGYTDILARAEDLLTDLEKGGGAATPAALQPTRPSEAVRRIAQEIHAFGETLVPASG